MFAACTILSNVQEVVDTEGQKLKMAAVSNLHPAVAS